MIPKLLFFLLANKWINYCVNALYKLIIISLIYIKLHIDRPYTTVVSILKGHEDNTS